MLEEFAYKYDTYEELLDGVIRVGGYVARLVHFDNASGTCPEFAPPLDEIRQVWTGFRRNLLEPDQVQQSPNLTEGYPHTCRWRSVLAALRRARAAGHVHVHICVTTTQHKVTEWPVGV